jgi:hypothetical protein
MNRLALLYYSIYRNAANIFELNIIIIKMSGCNLKYRGHLTADQ